MSPMPSNIFTQRDAELAGNMVKLISSRYTAKETAENDPQSGNPSFVNRYIHDYWATFCCTAVNTQIP